jgi:tetratricopeptide (TPR) repeat protein
MTLTHKMKFKAATASLIILFSGMLSQAQDLNAAIKLTTSEQYDLAGNMFKDLISKDPNNSDLYYFYGENYLKAYFTDSASMIFDEIAKPAAELFNTGIKVDPLNPINYVGLGKIAIYSRNLQEAKNYFNKAESLLPSRNNRKAPVTPSKHALTLMKIGEAYIFSPYPDTAIIFDYLRKSEIVDPKNPELYILFGDGYMKGNDGSNAIACYKKAQSLDPKSPKSNLRIGQLWMRTRNYNDALAYYKEAIKIDSTFAPAYRELAELYALARRYNEAIKTYNKFLSLSSTNLTAKVRYASFLFMAKEYQKSIDKISEIQKEDTSFIILNRLLAYSYFELNQPEKAILYIQKFLAKSNPQKIIPSDWNYYGKIMAKMKNDSVAIEYYMKGYNMDTSNYDALSDIAISYNRMKKYTEAASFYESKIKKNKATPNDYYNLGKVYYSASNWTQADTNFAIFISMQPNYVQAYQWRARTNANIDPDAIDGKAKPYFEILVQKALPDSAKFVKEITEAYSYFAYYYFKQYLLNKKDEDKKNAVLWCEKVLAIVPTDDKAGTIYKQFTGETYKPKTPQIKN